MTREPAAMFEQEDPEGHDEPTAEDLANAAIPGYTFDPATGTYAEAEDPASFADIKVGRPIAPGLRQDWTVLDVHQTGRNEGIVLVVRPHTYHPFVTERIGWRDGDNAFVVWSGTYHESLTEALAEFVDRVAAGMRQAYDDALGDPSQYR